MDLFVRLATATVAVSEVPSTENLAVLLCSYFKGVVFVGPRISDLELPTATEQL